MDMPATIWTTVRNRATKFVASLVPGGELAVDLATEILPGFVSQSVAARIKEAAMFGAYEIMAKTHRTVLKTLIWQNGLLLISLPLVFLLHSAIPFYGAYGCVIGYTIWSMTHVWPQIVGLLVTRSLTKTISRTIRDAIQADLLRRDVFQRAVVEWFGPDLDKIAEEIAEDLLPDIRMYALNLAFTLGMAFITFRWFLIPMLEQRALQ